MPLKEEIVKTLKALEGDGVLLVDGGLVKDKYYNMDIINKVLADSLPKKKVEIELPEHIVDRIFKAESRGLTLVEFLSTLYSEGEGTVDGKWFLDEKNQMILIKGWLDGYTVESD